MTHHLRSKVISVVKRGSVARMLTMSVIGVLTVHACLAQQQPGAQELSRQLEDAYAQHAVKIRKLLPQYSGTPLLLDLSHMHLEDGMCNPEQHVAWEGHFNGIMGGRARVADLGISKVDGATATTLTTIDTFEAVYSLPAKGSFTVVIAKPIAGRVCIPQSRAYVYTKFTLDVVKEFKASNSKEWESRKAGQIMAAQFGGSVRFPSGYLETFLLSQEGFVEVGKRYVFFMWKPIPSDDTLVISQAYLIQDGMVFPVSANGDAQTVYTDMPFPEFEAKVKAAVAMNADIDVLPHVHASKASR